MFFAMRRAKRNAAMGLQLSALGSRGDPKEVQKQIEKLEKD